MSPSKAQGADSGQPDALNCSLIERLDRKRRMVRKTASPVIDVITALHHSLSLPESRILPLVHGF